MCGQGGVWRDELPVGLREIHLGLKPKRRTGPSVGERLQVAYEKVMAKRAKGCRQRGATRDCRTNVAGQAASRIRKNGNGPLHRKAIEPPSPATICSEPVWGPIPDRRSGGGRSRRGAASRPRRHGWMEGCEPSAAGRTAPHRRIRRARPSDRWYHRSSRHYLLETQPWRRPVSLFMAASFGLVPSPLKLM